MITMVTAMTFSTVKVQAKEYKATINKDTVDYYVGVSATKTNGTDTTNVTAKKASAKGYNALHVFMNCDEGVSILYNKKSTSNVKSVKAPTTNSSKVKGGRGKTFTCRKDTVIKFKVIKGKVTKSKVKKAKTYYFVVKVSKLASTNVKTRNFTLEKGKTAQVKLNKKAFTDVKVSATNGRVSYDEDTGIVSFRQGSENGSFEITTYNGDIKIDSYKFNTALKLYQAKDMDNFTVDWGNNFQLSIIDPVRGFNLPISYNTVVGKGYEVYARVDNKNVERKETIDNSMCKDKSVSDYYNKLSNGWHTIYYKVWQKNYYRDGQSSSKEADVLTLLGTYEKKFYVYDWSDDLYYTKFHKGDYQCPARDGIQAARVTYIDSLGYLKTVEIPAGKRLSSVDQYGATLFVFVEINMNGQWGYQNDKRVLSECLAGWSKSHNSGVDLYASVANHGYKEKMTISYDDYAKSFSDFSKRYTWKQCAFLGYALDFSAPDEDVRASFEIDSYELATLEWETGEKCESCYWNPDGTRKDANMVTPDVPQ